MEQFNKNQEMSTVYQRIMFDALSLLVYLRDPNLKGYNSKSTL